MSDRTIQAHMGINISGIQARTLYDKEHWQVHQGKSFTAFQVNESMGDGDKINFGFKTPAVGEVHMVADFLAKTAAHMTIFEGANWSGGLGSGLAITIYNRNRQSATESELLTNINETGFSQSGQLNSDLTGLGGGTAFTSRYVFAARPSTPALQIGRHGWVLSGATKYAIEVEADAADSAATLILNWYEEGA